MRRYRLPKDFSKCGELARTAIFQRIAESEKQAAKSKSTKVETIIIKI